MPFDHRLSRRELLSLPLAAAGAPPLLAACAAADDANGSIRVAGHVPPVDDGAARHLYNVALPSVELPSTANRRDDLSTVDAPRLVVYAYPMTARPGVPLPAGWEDIPGARGCTPETCGFRDHRRELAQLQAEVFGVSTQSTEYQQEMVRRLHVPFEILSDDRLVLARALRLPTFVSGGMTLLKRLTLIVRAHRIEHVFYPVYPADKHADEVISWLSDHPL